MAYVGSVGSRKNRCNSLTIQLEIETVNKLKTITNLVILEYEQLLCGFRCCDHLFNHSSTNYGFLFNLKHFIHLIFIILNIF